MRLHNATDRIEKEIVLRAPQSRVMACACLPAFYRQFGFHAGDSEAEQRRVMPETTLVVVHGAANVDRHAPSSPHRSNPARGHLNADQTISERRIVSAALKK